MKRTYIQPAIIVVKMQHQSIICTSTVNNISGNADIDYIGGGSGPARTRESCGIWDDEW